MANIVTLLFLCPTHWINSRDFKSINESFIWEYTPCVILTQVLLTQLLELLKEHMNWDPNVMLCQSGLVTGFSCVNVQCLGELRVLVWRRAGGRLTLSRADLWEWKEKFEHLNYTPKIRKVVFYFSFPLLFIFLIFTFLLRSAESAPIPGDTMRWVELRCAWVTCWVTPTFFRDRFSPPAAWCGCEDSGR